jgi:lysophospholipase L1-like esterase
MADRFRLIAYNLAAVAFGAIVAVGLLELALRIHNPIVQTVKGNQIVVRVNYDQVLKNDYIPGVAPVVRIHHNSLGFRGSDPPADLQNWLSIVAVGGSTTRSATQSDDRMWTTLVGNKLSECFNRVWINNAGFDGHSSYAHTQLVRDYIVKLRPKIAVILVGANDAHTNLDAAGSDDLNAFDREQIIGDINFDAGLTGFLKSLSNRSEVMSLGLTFYRSFRAWLVGLNYQILDWKALPEGNALPSDADAQLAAARARQTAYAARVRAMVGMLRDAGTVPVLMTQPTPFGDAKDPATGKDLSRVEHGLFRHARLELYNDTLRRLARDEKVDLIDLERHLSKDTRYYWDYVHYTDAGAQKVADIVADRLLPVAAKNFKTEGNGACRLQSSGL